MNIILGETAGFCYGVKRAVQGAKEVASKEKNVSCLGELVHNKEVINNLKESGINFIDTIQETSENLIIRAHGCKKEIYDIAKNMKVNVFDYTCPNVIKIHEIVEEYTKKGYFTFLIGNKEHPENIGTISFCENRGYIIESEKNIDTAIEKLYKSNIKNLLIVVQTTFSTILFETIKNNIINKVKDIDNIEIRNTICNATRLRQEETEKMSKTVECMIIIGGKNSSNTNKLYTIAKENCKNTYIVENEKELLLKEIQKFENIGIMAGASTPKESIDNVIDAIKN